MTTTTSRANKAAQRAAAKTAATDEPEPVVQADAAEPETGDADAVVIVPEPGPAGDPEPPAAGPDPEPEPEAPSLAYFYVTVPAADAERFTVNAASDYPGVTFTATAPPKARKARAEAKELPFPPGVIAPIAFRKLLAAEGLVRGGLTGQMVYGWLNQKGFPVTHYADDGTAYEAKQTGPDGKATTRPGVHVDEARAWYLAKTASNGASK